MNQTAARVTAAIGVALLLIPVTIVGIGRMGRATMVIISGSAIVAYFVWLATTWRHPADSARVMRPFIVLIAMELIHMGEEQVTNFPGSLAKIFNIPSTFNLLAHAVALMGAVNALAMLAALGLRSRIPLVRQFANYFVWFYVIGPGLVNAVAHVIFPFIAGTIYFSGLVTVILPTAAGIRTLKRLVRGEAAARLEPAPVPEVAAS